MDWDEVELQELENMRNKRKALLPETGRHGHSRKAASGRRATREPMEACSGRPTLDADGNTSATIWEYTLGQQVAEARAACLQGLSRIPSGLGKLAYLAILQHRLLGDHEELFEEWRCCSPRQQYDLLLGSVNAEGGGVLTDTWLNPSVYSELIPASARKPARTAHLANLRSLLEMAKKELSEAQHRAPEDALLEG
jgi:hypothetical protein